MLIEHPAIAEAAVVPAPDPVRLSVPKTFITLRQGYEEAPSAGHLPLLARSSRAVQAHSPPAVRGAAEDDLGKIRRVELRRREIERGDDASERMPGEYWEEDFAAELK